MVILKAVGGCWFVMVVLVSLLFAFWLLLKDPLYLRYRT